ncbi:methylaspartate mutase [Amycolatopsis magusensis]|uniref:Methylaspartate mutase epsilon subunit n=1 Tax=Amycolatopsis magusensis TaxID=882444 RepID=A0ABS4PXP9_9PSEU|nr:methylaspartate mutase [Amycolatopsis magusensis]MBP2184204.1 methylaspartate mutase epsilon subunit [Amycolatopsis magusensis]
MLTAGLAPVRAASFGDFVARAAAAGRLVVQPRMGFSDPDRLRAGLAATKAADAVTVGTLTLDSYTRVGDHTAALEALTVGADLNGYPLVAHGPETTRAVLAGLAGDDFPVQVRHGSAVPGDIIAALGPSGLHATEGGPVSYCLPYGRTPLRESVDNWRRACELLAELRAPGVEPHLETFGGCLMGQLCPPGLLVALSVLEALFFTTHGLRSVSLSYAQQTDPEQDAEAVRALRTLATELLPGVQHHIVVYTYMGVYPRTPEGATRLLELAAELAVRTGAERLIVKTVAEAFRIPTVAENVAALEAADRAARRTAPEPSTPDDQFGILAEARALVEAVLELADDPGRALLTAFARGHLDVPYCLHPDNAGRSRGYLDDRGRLRWAETGAMPVAADRAGTRPMTAAGLLTALSHVERRLDRAALGTDRLGVHR